MVIEEQAPVQEIEPATFTSTQVEVAEVPFETVMESPAVQLEETHVRKRRASTGIKRKTVAPRIKAAGAIVKRTRKKISPPPEEGNAG